MADLEETQPEHLDNVALFRFLGKEVRALVAAAFEKQAFPFGSVIVREGDDADALFVLTAGRARVLRVGDDGNEVALNVLIPGDTFGEIGMLEGGRRTATVRASGQVTVLRLDASVFHALRATYPEVQKAAQLTARHIVLRDFLQMTTAFGKLPAGELTALVASLEPVAATAGEVLFRKGDFGQSLFIVQQGRLRAYRDTGGSSGGDLAYYRLGDVFGERSLMTGEPRAATVEAVSDVQLLMLGREQYTELMSSSHGFREQIATRIGHYGHQAAAVPLDFAEELPPTEPRTEIPVHTADPIAFEHGMQGDTTGDIRFLQRPRIRRFALVRGVDEMDCGAACLAMVCRHFGRSVALSRVRRAAGTALDGTTLRGLVNGAEELGLAARALKVSRRNLDTLPLPAVMHWGGNHWIVAWSVTPTHVRVADPSVGLRSVRRDEVDRKWSGYAAVFASTPTFEEAQEGSVGVRWLWPFFRPQLRAISSAAILALFVGALQMTLPVFLQVVVDRVIPERNVDLLRLMLISLAGLVVVMTIGSALQRLMLSKAAVRIDREALDFLTTKLLALPMGYFYARRTGDIQRRLAGVRLVREFAVQSGVVALTALTQLLAAMALMLYYSPFLTLIFVALTPVYAALMRIASRRMRPIFESLEEAFGDYFSRQIDAVKGIEAVKALAAEDQLRRQLQREFEGLSRRLFRADFTAMAYDGAVQLLTFVSLSLFLWAGSTQVLAGDLTIGALVSFNTLVVLANGSIIVVLLLWDELQLNAVLINRLGDVIEEEPEQGSDHSHLRQVHSLEGGVRLDRVCFAYGENSPKILDNLSLDVPPGTTVAVVGRSGSGKTTLAKCLAGLVQPTGGRILYDGVDLTTLDYRSLRRNIGLVLQDNFLFSETIAANIAFGHESPDPDKVQWAAKVANAHDFVQRLPLGYDTRVGETGLLLSGGQRQRIAIARAVYSRPTVLILDEATSSLDVESERAVHDHLDRLLEDRTSFIIAHRLSTVRHADLIVVLERGRLVEQGTHDELLARRGVYFYLAGQQLDS